MYVRLYFRLPFYLFIIMQTKHQIFGSHLTAAKRTKYQKVLNWKKLNHDSQGSIHILRRGREVQKIHFFVYFQYLKYAYIEGRGQVLYTVFFLFFFKSFYSFRFTVKPLFLLHFCFEWQPILNFYFKISHNSCSQMWLIDQLYIKLGEGIQKA